ncbi:MAG: hypothetical protein EB150_07920 [Nitrososphaeria archaeon]|nr:hypothetical protein [Nitrososphaeria archaeon]
MKLAIFALTALILSSFSASAFAIDYSFQTRMIPEKIMVGSEGIVQIHALKNGNFFPKQINDITVTSSDHSAVKILETKADGSTINVKIKAIKEGNTGISIAAQGFTPQKFPITIFDNKNNQAKLSLKVTPNTFDLNGPTKGYISIELTDSAGNPTKAIADTAIKLTVSKNNIINLKEQDVVIKKGEYYTIKEFTVTKYGDVTVYASSDNMETVSDTISVNEGSTPLKVKLYVYPKTISSSATSYSYAIVQLQDSSGKPTKAIQDIPVSIKITDTELESVNSSPIYEQIQASGPLVIPKDSYWGYIKLVTRHGLTGTFDVSISTQNYEVSSAEQLESVDVDLLDDKYPKLESLPILATGNDELIGVVHLEDASGNPVGAERDFPVPIDSSDNNALLVKNTLLKRGFSAELVFAKVGLVQPDSLTLKFPSEIDETVSPTITGPTKESLSLNVEPLISKAITDTSFPVFAYLSDGNTFTNFLEDTEMRVSPNDYFKIENQKIHKGQSGVLFDALALKDGSGTISFETAEHSAILDMESVMASPASISVTGPSTVYANLENIFTAQILDSQNQPMYSAKDMQIQLVANDKSILDTPASVTIPKGEYYAIFSAEAKKTGSTEIVALSDGLPITQYPVDVAELLPSVAIIGPDSAKPDSSVTVSLSAQYSGVPMPEMNVQWNANNAQIMSADQTTNSEGISTATLVPESDSVFSVDATVSGPGFSAGTASKSIEIMDESEHTTTPKPLSINGFDPLPIIVPGAIASGAILIKKKSIVEKIKSQQS